jgi:hypothetical protein
MMVDVNALDDAPLPFAPSPGAKRSDDDDDSPRTTALDPDAVRAALASATPFRGKAPTGDPGSPRTMAIDVSQLAPPPAHAAQAPSPSPSQPRGAKRFSINVFASLTAEMAERPGEVDAIRKKYGVTEAEHHEESQRWTEDFANNDDLRKRYFGIVQRYRGYLKGGGK